MFHASFPSSLKEDINRVLEIMPIKTYSNVKVGISEDNITNTVNGIEISFPYRIYFMDVLDDNIIEQLDGKQRMILHCIYTRSCNGFVREKHIRALLQMNYEDWAIPYIIKVCDEYVVEILETVYSMINENDIPRFKAICFENKYIFCKSYNRMISYWNAYYRHKYPDFKKYIGRKLFRECFGYVRNLESKSQKWE